MSAMELKISTVLDLIEYLEGIPPDTKVGMTSWNGSFVQFSKGEVGMTSESAAGDGYVSFNRSCNHGEN